MAASVAAPLAAVGNLRFTARGVYADYLVSGLPFIFLAKDWQDKVAAAHAELLRTLPSGAMLSGLTTPVATRNITRRMLHAHPDLQPANGCEPAPRRGPGLDRALPDVGGRGGPFGGAAAYPLAEPAAGLRAGRAHPDQHLAARPGLDPGPRQRH